MRQTALQTFGTLVLSTVVLQFSPATAQPSYPPDIPGTRELVYKEVGDTALKLWLCEPQGAGGSRPAVVFFFGGGWRQGTPTQFAPHCRHFAERGMLVALADYRVANRHGVTADACVQDAKSAVAFLRRNAAELGIDPERIAAGGGSAGGHLAAATSLLPAHNPPDVDDASLWKPNALALFNPALVLAPRAGDGSSNGQDEARRQRLSERLGGDLESMSPYHHLSDALPPTIIFHGTADTTVPHETAEAFCRKAEELGRDCTLESTPGAAHGFFNLRAGDGSAYRKTLGELDAFFVGLGWIDAGGAASGR